jgi:hypothetical protein
VIFSSCRLLFFFLVFSPRFFLWHICSFLRSTRTQHLIIPIPAVKQ